MTTTKRSPLQAIGYGAGAGVIASLAMAMYAMLAAWEKGTGFFTPLYHIASLWAPGDDMMASMQEAMSGSDFHFVFGTAILGAMIHMMTGAMYGAVFGLIVSRLNLKLAVLAGVGLIYGAIVFAMSALIGLPLAAAIFDSGDPIETWPRWPAGARSSSSTSSSASPSVCCSASPEPVWALLQTRLCTPTDNHLPGNGGGPESLRSAPLPPPMDALGRKVGCHHGQCTAALPHRGTD